MSQEQANNTKRRKDLLEEKRHVTGKVSDLCRFIGFGLLAIFYTMLVSDNEFANHVREGRSWWVIFAMGVSGVVAISADYLQFVFGAKAVQQALDRPQLNYDPSTRAYRGRITAYMIKQVAIGIGAVALALLLFIGLAETSGGSTTKSKTERGFIFMDRHNVGTAIPHTWETG